MGFPSLLLENQFGERSNNYVVGGSNAITAQFVVASADAGGLGITGLLAQGIAAVCMHTSQTPGTGNPNPAAGYILVQFSQRFNAFSSFRWSALPPGSGSDLLVASAGLTAGLVYQISVLGTTTQAQWELLGVPAGVTAAVGLAFVAIATSCTGTGAVQVPVTGGTAIVSINPLGSPVKGCKPDGSTAWVLLACYQAGGTFAGSALANHTHNLLLKNAAVADGATTRVNAGANLLGANTGSDITVTGAGANGGVVNASAGTPAGTITGALVIGAPVDGTTIVLNFGVVPNAASMI